MLMYLDGNVCSGSYDATAGLITFRRHLGFDSSDQVSGSAVYIVGTWTADQFLTKPFLNVGNVLCGCMHGSLTFKSRMSIGYIKGPGDRSDYILRFMPDINPPDGPSAAGPDPFIDDLTAPVTVVDDPATCRWTVTGDSPFVGVFHKTATSGEHAGWFTCRSN